MRTHILSILAAALVLVIPHQIQAQPQEYYIQAVDTTVHKLNTSHQYGTLFIPSAGVNLPIYAESDIGEENGQAIVDKKDSALLQRFGETTLISDHAGQGFDVLRRLQTGARATMYTRDKDLFSYEYKKSVICTRASDVYWDEKEENGAQLRKIHILNRTLIDRDGCPVLYDKHKYNFPIAMQCCNDDDTVTVTFWDNVPPED